MPIILVVDDSETERQLIGGLLKCKLDWIVQYAKDGSEACDLVGQVFPDLIITDLQMPIMDGIQTIEAILAIDDSVRILVISALADKATLIKAMSLGAYGFVCKPFTDYELEDAVEHLIEDILV